MSSSTYLLTGASGFLGREIVRRIGQAEPEARLYVLLRAPAGEVEARAAALGLRRLAPRLIAVAGDLTILRLGLSPRDQQRLGEEVTHVIHAGASVRFDLPLAQARRINVFGTAQVLDAASRMKRLDRFLHVSTAYLAGRLRGTLLEAPVHPSAFRNSYEQSKHAAEETLRARMTTLPITIARPSIIGPALGCEASAPFLSLLRLYVQRGWRWVPGSPSSLVDLVPVDLVARALHGLATRRLAEGRWYHLAAGPRAATLGQLGALAAEEFNCRRLTFLAPGLFRAAARTLVHGRTRAALDHVAAYVPYLSVQTRIDTTDSRRVLRDIGVELPYSADYFRCLLREVKLRADREPRAGGHATRDAAARPPEPVPDTPVASRPQPAVLAAAPGAERTAARLSGARAASERLPHAPENRS
jgi:nucleoside-diphosphate-sugar epimerase